MVETYSPNGSSGSDLLSVALDKFEEVDDMADHKYEEYVNSLLMECFALTINPISTFKVGDEYYHQLSYGKQITIIESILKSVLIFLNEKYDYALLSYYVFEFATTRDTVHLHAMITCCRAPDSYGQSENLINKHLKKWSDDFNYSKGTYKAIDFKRIKDSPADIQRWIKYMRKSPSSPAYSYRLSAKYDEQTHISHQHMVR